MLVTTCIIPWNGASAMTTQVVASTARSYGRLSSGASRSVLLEENANLEAERGTFRRASLRIFSKPEAHNSCMNTRNSTPRLFVTDGKVKGRLTFVRRYCSCRPASLGSWRYGTISIHKQFCMTETACLWGTSMGFANEYIKPPRRYAKNNM